MEEQASGAQAVVKAMERMREMVRSTDFGFDRTGGLLRADVEDGAEYVGVHGPLHHRHGPQQRTRWRSSRSCAGIQVRIGSDAKQRGCEWLKICKSSVFGSDTETFGVPINSVHEIVRMMDITVVPDAPVYIEGVINLRGKIIPVVDLRKRFGEKEIKVVRRTESSSPRSGRRWSVW